MEVPTQRYSTYPHPIPIQHQVFPTYRIRTARQIQLSPPSTNSYPHTYPTSIPPNSTPESTLLQPTRPDHRPYQKPSVHYPINRHTLPPPNQTHSHSSTRPNYSTIPTPYIVVPSKPSPLLPLYVHPTAKTLISPSKAHMSLGRFCCALTIEYKCKTSRKNKRL